VGRGVVGFLAGRNHHLAVKFLGDVPKPQRIGQAGAQVVEVHAFAVLGVARANFEAAAAAQQHQVGGHGIGAGRGGHGFQQVARHLKAQGGLFCGGRTGVEIGRLLAAQHHVHGGLVVVGIGQDDVNAVEFPGLDGEAALAGTGGVHRQVVAFVYPQLLQGAALRVLVPKIDEVGHLPGARRKRHRVDDVLVKRPPVHRHRHPLDAVAVPGIVEPIKALHQQPHRPKAADGVGPGGGHARAGLHLRGKHGLGKHALHPRLDAERLERERLQGGGHVVLNFRKAAPLQRVVLPVLGVAHFPVQVRTRRAAGVARQRHHLAALHQKPVLVEEGFQLVALLLVLAVQQLGRHGSFKLVEVAVHRGQAVGMSDI